MKTIPICSKCGSDNVTIEALCYWDVDQQKAVSESIMDDGHYCNDCDKHVKLYWEEIA